MITDPFTHRSRLEEGRIINTANAEIWVHDTGGSGEPVFLIGGFTAGHFVFDLIRPFMQNYRLITWEPRGLGLSRANSGIDTELNADVWAADAAEVLDILGIDCAKVWATGFGSYIAFALTAMYPQKVSALATYTDVWAEDETKVYERIWAVYSAIVENFGIEGFGARVLANVFDVTGLPWFGDWEAHNIEQVLRLETVNDTVGYCCTRADVRSHLPKIAAPVLIVQGGLSWDGEVVKETSDPSLSLLQESISGLEVVTIAGAHPAYVLVQQPEACAAAVRGFFERENSG
ncbi:MAG: pimeloyl-ACP methyl ester carboxylesterase [Gammaproteobacteria bacterium]|jgi:pimeloyl-ACP methyl ester carboxylesterase